MIHGSIDMPKADSPGRHGVWHTHLYGYLPCGRPTPYPTDDLHRSLPCGMPMASASVPSSTRAFPWRGLSGHPFQSPSWKTALTSQDGCSAAPRLLYLDRIASRCRRYFSSHQIDPPLFHLTITTLFHSVVSPMNGCISRNAKDTGPARRCAGM